MAQQSAVRSLVEAFTADLEALIRAEIRRGFETAMGTVAAPRAASRTGRASRAPGTAFSAPGRRKGEKRSPEQLAALKAALLARVTRTPGSRIEEIGRDMKLPTKDLQRPLSQLVAAKGVRKTGVKRATRYFPTGR